MKHNPFSAPEIAFVGEALKPLRVLGATALVFLGASAYAGGGGQNMLLIVNPNDEPSLRIANAYVKARHIPTNNILYIVPPSVQGFTLLNITYAQFQSTYQSAVPAAIAARGLTDQIDYIGTIGQPHAAAGVSFQSCLNQLTQLQNGMAASTLTYRYSELLYYQNSPRPTGQSVSKAFTYVHGNNPAIHHSTKYAPLPASIVGSSATTGTANYAQWYMAGMIGYSGMYGLTTTQVIQSLLRTVAGDGTKPAGTMPGEYTFSLFQLTPQWTGMNLAVDGVTVLSWDCWNGGTLNLLSGYIDTARSVYLLPGEHTLAIKLANSPSGSTSVTDANLNFRILFRWVDSNFRGTDKRYNVAVPAAAPQFNTVRKSAGN